MTHIYCVQHADGFTYVPTKREALEMLRSCQEGGDTYANVTRETVTDRLGRRELYCSLLNSEGWSTGGTQDVAGHVFV